MNVGDDTRVVGDVDPYGMRGRNVGDDTRVVGDVDPYGLKDIQIIVGDDVLDVPNKRKNVVGDDVLDVPNKRKNCCRGRRPRRPEQSTMSLSINPLSQRNYFRCSVRSRQALRQLVRQGTPRSRVF